MTEQPNQRPEGSGAGNFPPPYEPPAFVPPRGSDVPPPPMYNANQTGAPYGHGQYGSAPYGQSGYYGMQPQPKGLSIASMVCGIVAVVFGFIMIPQIAAIITGHLAMKREPTAKGMSITGLVLGYLCLVGYGLVWLLVIVGMALASSTYGY